MRDVVIVGGARTAVGSFGGSLKGIRAVDLGALVSKEAIRRAGLRPDVSATVRACRPDVFRETDKTELQKKYYDYPDALSPVYFDECIMGNVLQAGLGQNPGRQAGIYAGLPEETNAITINKVCASGMKAIALAAQSIKAGDAEAVVAGGLKITVPSESKRTSAYVGSHARTESATRRWRKPSKAESPTSPSAMASFGMRTKSAQVPVLM